jgi:hypothetical protein
MIKCSSGKKVYASQELAEEALLEAWTRYNLKPENGPVAVYKCDDCGYFHLTSKGPMSSTLAQHLADGKIQRQQEANYWQERLKNR